MHEVKVLDFKKLKLHQRRDLKLLAIRKGRLKSSKDPHTSIYVGVEFVILRSQGDPLKV